MIMAGLFELIKWYLFKGIRVKKSWKINIYQTVTSFISISFILLYPSISLIIKSFNFIWQLSTNTEARPSSLQAQLASSVKSSSKNSFSPSRTSKSSTSSSDAKKALISTKDSKNKSSAAHVSTESETSTATTSINLFKRKSNPCTKL